MERFGLEQNNQQLEKRGSREFVIEEVKISLTEIDQNVLREILLETLTPARAESALEGFLPIEKVTVMYDETVRSRGLFKSKVDSKEEASIVLNAEKLGRLRAEDISLATLYTYVHEQVHALSTDYRKHTSYETNIPDQKFVGFKKIEKSFDEKEEKAIYTEINEGMTEMIAEEIAREYLRRTGEVSGNHRDRHHVENSFAVYMDYKVLVDGIIDQLASRLEQTREVVKKALIVEFFRKKSPSNNFTDWLEKNYPDIAQGAVNPKTFISS